MRLAVSPDDRFFVSGSFDSTCRIWELGKIDASDGLLESSTTYTGHAENSSSPAVRVNDVAIVENSHSVVSAASDGSVHVWRVDLVSSTPNASNHQHNQQHQQQRLTTVSRQ